MLHGARRREAEESQHEMQKTMEQIQGEDDMIADRARFTAFMAAEARDADKGPRSCLGNYNALDTSHLDPAARAFVEPLLRKENPLESDSSSEDGDPSGFVLPPTMRAAIQAIKDLGPEAPFSQKQKN